MTRARSRRAPGALVAALLAVLAVLAVHGPVPTAAAPRQALPPTEPTEPTEPTPVTVAVREIEPFVVVGDGGDLSGFSIELWDAIAAGAGLDTEYVVVDRVTDQLDAVASGRADVAVGAISVTAEREQRWDFSQPIADGGLSVLTTARDERSWWSKIGTVAGVVGWFVLGLFVLLVLAGHVIWLVERRRNPDIPDDYLHGVPEAMWFAVVSVFTVGYGDHVPRSPIGRLVTVAFIILGVVAVSQFTATLASRLTAERLTTPVQSVEDLGGRPVAVVAGTTSAEAMRRRPVEVVEAPDLDAAGRLLLAGRVDAVVFDQPALKWFSKGAGNGRTAVVGGIFDPEYYGVAAADGSGLIERIDRALLDLREDGTWQRIHDEWFR